MDLPAQTAAMMEDFFAKVPLTPGALIVLGLSSSEVAGGVIGKASSPDIGDAVVAGVRKALAGRGLDLAVQCCEHLNRALVMERSAAARRGAAAVSVVPYPRAGGSAATAAYAQFGDPVVVEAIAADAGIDIGVTMIGMHLRPVVVPVRAACVLGAARVDFAYARPKYIGGERARYG